jgi:hypothetical protein
VHNIEEMVCNVERHGDDDQYSNDKLVKYKKMIEDSKKQFYLGCVTQYMRLFVNGETFLVEGEQRWSDCSFKDLLMLLKDITPRTWLYLYMVIWSELRAVVALIAAPLDQLHLSVAKVNMIGWLARTLRAGDTMAR